MLKLLNAQKLELLNVRILKCSICSMLKAPKKMLKKPCAL